MTVQRSLGHAKTTTSLNTYAHLWPTAEDRTRKAAESIITASLGQPEAPEIADDLSGATDRELALPPSGKCVRRSDALAGCRHSRVAGKPSAA